MRGLAPSRRSNWGDDSKVAEVTSSGESLAQCVIDWVARSDHFEIGTAANEKHPGILGFLMVAPTGVDPVTSRFSVTLVMYQDMPDKTGRL